MRERAGAPSEQPPGRPRQAEPAGIVCLGEAIVDLVCEREVASMADADAFAPHCGGALANVAVAAARAGARVALAGGVGADQWGRWLRNRLSAEGVDVKWLALVEGVQTPVAFVAVDHDREPTFQIYGDGISAGVRALAGRVQEPLAAAEALVFGSNTLVGEPERELTEKARALALERGIPVLFDPNLRPNRWNGSLETAVELCRRLAGGAALIRANAGEAALIGGVEEGDPERAAEALVELGAAVAVVTLGERGALVRGAACGQAPAPRVETVSPMGAGDAFLGELAAGLAARGWDLAQTVALLPDACAAGARACLSWGALA